MTSAMVLREFYVFADRCKGFKVVSSDLMTGARVLMKFSVFADKCKGFKEILRI